MGKMKEKVFSVVQEVVFNQAGYRTRSELARMAVLKLNEQGVNCARDDTKAGDYLCEALDKYL